VCSLRPQDSPSTQHEQQRPSTHLQICRHSINYYAAGAWWGYTSANDRQHLAALIKRDVRSGLCSDCTTSLAEMVDSADEALFQRILYNLSHVLHQLLPDRRITGH